MSIKTPNYVTTEDVTIDLDKFDRRVLPAGSFVTPVGRQYVPKHVLERSESMFSQFEPRREVYCFTRFGFVRMLQNQLRER